MSMGMKGLYSSLRILVLLLISASSVHADPKIAPITPPAEGQTYGRWAAAWQEWAFEIPAAENPVLDTTGQYCAQRQVDVVWFLAGSFFADPVVRTCNIPAGKSLFFPLINTNYFAFLNDPPDQRTEKYVRDHAVCTLPAQITVSIDGSKVPQPTRYFTGPSGSQSPIFNVQLPPGNVFEFFGVIGIPELALTPSAEQGYYLFLSPLSTGNHTIRWVASGCTPNNPPQDITYLLKISG